MLLRAGRERIETRRHGAKQRRERVAERASTACVEQIDHVVRAESLLLLFRREPGREPVDEARVGQLNLEPRRERRAEGQGLGTELDRFVELRSGRGRDALDQLGIVLGPDAHRVAWLERQTGHRQDDVTRLFRRVRTVEVHVLEDRRRRWVSARAERIGTARLRCRRRRDRSRGVRLGGRRRCPLDERRDDLCQPSFERGLVVDVAVLTVDETRCAELLEATIEVLSALREALVGRVTQGAHAEGDARKRRALLHQIRVQDLGVRRGIAVSVCARDDEQQTHVLEVGPREVHHIDHLRFEVSRPERIADAIREPLSVPRLGAEEDMNRPHDGGH